MTLFRLERTAKIGVDAQEFDLVRLFIFEHADEVRVDDMVQYRSSQAVGSEHRDVLCLQVFVGDVVYLVLIGLWIFFQGLILPVDCLEQQNILDAVVELFIFQAAKFEEGRDVVPIFFIGLALIFEDLMQLVRNLLGDVLGDHLDLAVILQKAARNIQRHIRAVDDTFEQQQKFRDDLLDVVRNEDLIAVKFDLTGDELQFILLLREVEDTLEVKWVVDVEVNPEQRLIEIHKDFVVKRLVFLVGAVLWRFQPQRMGVVDRTRFDNLLLFRSVLVLFRISLLVVDSAFLVVRIQVDLVRHKLTVLVQDLVDARLLQKFLLLVGDVHDDRCAMFGAISILNFVAVLAGRSPVYRRRTLLIG